MGRETYALFSPFQIGDLPLSNRLVRSATYEAAMTEDGRVTDAMIRLYRRLAEGGVGLIVTGGMAVAPLGRCSGKVYAREACLFADAQIDQVARIAQIAHESGSAKVIAQLGHAGRQVTVGNLSAEAVGPSRVDSPILDTQARLLYTHEINRLVRCFAQAARRAQLAGFDGVQLQAAHGFLLSSFLSPYTNRREDEYGGSGDGRLKIIAEIVTATRELVGRWPILIKVNADDLVEGGITPETLGPLVADLARTGVEAIELSGGMWDSLARGRDALGFTPLPPPEARTATSDRSSTPYWAEALTDLQSTAPIILGGGNRNVERMEQMVVSGETELMAMARPLICEPDLPARWLQGQGDASARCGSCNVCWWAVQRGEPLQCMAQGNPITYAWNRYRYHHGWQRALH